MAQGSHGTLAGNGDNTHVPFARESSPSFNLMGESLIIPPAVEALALLSMGIPGDVPTDAMPLRAMSTPPVFHARSSETRIGIDAVAPTEVGCREMRRYLASDGTPSLPKEVYSSVPTAAVSTAAGASCAAEISPTHASPGCTVPDGVGDARGVTLLLRVVVDVAADVASDDDVDEELEPE